MLVAVIMMFVVLSFTGVAVLDISYTSKTASLETVSNVKVQYLIESSVNTTLWKMNSGADSLVNVTTDGISTFWNDTTNILTVTLDTLNVETEVAIDLSEDTHFNHSLASTENIITNGYSVDSESESRKFNFLLGADLQFLQDNAVQVHSQSFKTYRNGDFSTPGIHIITGSFIELENVQINGTLVFTGRFITFDKIFKVNADTTQNLPAIVFTDERSSAWFYENNGGDNIEVNGAVYSAGKIIMRDGDFTGPIIGKVIELQNDITFTPDYEKKYHRWNQGFGSEDSYDWPKQISRWQTKSWKKSGHHHS